MTRGYFVLEMKGLLHAAALMSDAYLEGYGKEIIEAFLNNNEERLLDTLRAKMNEKDRTEMDRYICPEWYRITKKSEAKDYIAEYGSIIISKHDFKDGKCVKQLDTPKVLEMSDESLPTLKCKFRISKENSKAISIDPATGTIASNSTEEKISVSSDGKVTIKSTEKETYIVECVISADHYKTLAKPIYIYVR